MSRLSIHSTWTEWLDVPVAFWMLCLAFGAACGLLLGVIVR